jgi:uncharacterized protein involved in exopolysaccharide biosynthesis
MKRRMTFSITVIGTALALLFVLLIPTIYTSTTTLMPPDNTTSSSNLLSLLSASSPAASSVGSALLGVKSPGGVFIGVLGSRTVQEHLVARFDLLHLYKKRLVQDACKQLAANTHITEDQKSGIISIGVDSNDPATAAQIAQGYITELDNVMTHNSTSAARRERVFLEGRLAEVKQDLDDSSRALSEFATKNKTMDVPSQAKDMVEAGLRLQSELVAASSELAALRQSYSDDNFRVRAAAARVAELHRQMAKITGSSRVQGEEEDTEGTDYPTIRELPALGLAYSDLDRRVRMDEALWEALTKQYELAKVQEAREIPTVRVLDVANVPQRKSFPARSSILLLGALLSFFTACIVALARSLWEEMDAQDERKMLLKEIGSVVGNPQLLLWRLPGMGWVHSHLFG